MSLKYFTLDFNNVIPITLKYNTTPTSLQKAAVHAQQMPTNALRTVSEYPFHKTLTRALTFNSKRCILREIHISVSNFLIMSLSHLSANNLLWFKRIQPFPYIV